MTIKILEPDLVNKIAAGEVIERPANIIKEILENSLDAGCKCISIKLVDFGKGLIEIEDDGFGISSEDLPKTILPHATSKINSFDDLYDLNSLGFRGEALASISSVSIFSIESQGKMLSNSSGSWNLCDSSIFKGTKIIIKDLFYNVPVRKKFLKSDQVELSHILDTFKNYALSRIDVSFKLLHEGKELINCPETSSLKNRLVSLYGAKIIDELVEINAENISGYVSLPYHCRNSKSNQNIFVNGRYIKSKQIIESVYQAYHSMLFTQKHPFIFLNLNLDPKSIDVNIHPQKYEIKIDNFADLSKGIIQAIYDSINSRKSFPKINFETNNVTSKPRYSFEKSTQEVLPIINESASIPIIKQNVSLKPILNKENVVRTLPEIRLLGQVHKTFFLAECEGGFYIIDQHAAHERVMYEKFMKEYSEGKVSSQRLLSPIFIDFSVDEISLIDQSSLNKIGLEYDLVSNNQIKVLSVPSVFSKSINEDKLRSFIQDSKNFDTHKEEIITRMACRSSVMAGQELTLYQINDILNKLSYCEKPFTCPHGRPTLIRYDVLDIEKKFRRC